MSNPPPVMFPAGALHLCPVVLGCLPPVTSWQAASRGRLGIGYRITAARLQGKVEIACCKEATQALTTLAWSAPLDAVSSRVLAEALRNAAHPGSPARLHVFAAAARQLFRHAVLTLAPRPGGRKRRRRFRLGTPDAFAPEAACDASFRPDDLPTAIDDLRDAARLQPRVTLTDCAAVDLVSGSILPALNALFADLGTCLERSLQPLQPHIGPDAVRAIILETRRALDDLAACHRAGDEYIESLAITAAGDKPLSIEIESSLGAAL